MNNPGDRDPPATDQRPLTTYLKHGFLRDLAIRLRDLRVNPGLQLMVCSEPRINPSDSPIPGRGSLASTSYSNWTSSL